VVNGEEECRMVVEVKHYKKSARWKFVDIFEDYARAHLKAQVYLVNHGPSGEAVNQVSEYVQSRCHSIENLTSSDMQKRNEFTRAVRECVGEPIQAWPLSTEGVDDQTVLVVDVSASMQTHLHLPEVEVFVGSLAAAHRPRELVGVDTAIVGSWPAMPAGFADLIQSGGGGTDLGEAIRTLLQNAQRVLVITDQSQPISLQGLEVKVQDVQAEQPENVYVWVCNRIEPPVSPDSR
jgi:hypothetical protein